MVVFSNLVGIEVSVEFHIYLVVVAGNLSLQYLNLNICTFRFGLGVQGCLVVGRAY